MKSCKTCRHYREDLECFIRHCAHPSAIKFDKVRGELMPPIREAIDACDLERWEPIPSFWQRIKELFA